MTLESLETLATCLNTTPAPNETLFVLASHYLGEDYYNTPIVTQISAAMLNQRFASVRADVEARFVVSIEQGWPFETAVFKNFELAIKAGRINSNTVGFLAYAVQYEMYKPQFTEAIDWFKKILLKPSKTQPQSELMSTSGSLRAKYVMEASKADLVTLEDDQREAQAILALNALNRLAMLHLENLASPADAIPDIASIIEYVATHEYEFVQSKYRMRMLLHTLADTAKKSKQPEAFRPAMQRIVDHDVKIPSALLIQLKLGAPQHASEKETDIKDLLIELRKLNKANTAFSESELETLITYVDKNIRLIKQQNSKFGFDKHRRIVLNKYSKRPGEIGNKEVHLYNRNRKLFLRWFDSIGALVEAAATGISQDEHEHFEAVLQGIEASEPNDQEIICRIANCTPAWTIEKFQSWANDFQTGVRLVDDSTIPEVISVVSFAYHLTVAKEKFFPRDHQLMAILLRFKDPSLLLGIETGGGKTLILAIGNAIEALQGLTGHTLTVSKTLAKRDAEKQKSFFDKLGLTVTHNTGGGHARQALLQCKPRLL